MPAHGDALDEWELLPARRTHLPLCSLRLSHPRHRLPRWQAGHDVVAMGLPTDDTSATCDTFADVICSALDERDDDVVVVGHSYGGFVIPLVAARRPPRHLV
jgi:pimeloyl-ACP methyl ester carboxylesterase